MQSDRQRGSDYSFPADNTNFDTPSIADQYHQRRHTFVQKITMFDLLSRFVHDGVVRQIHKFQVGAKQTVFVVREGEQNNVFYLPAADIGPHARNYRDNVGRWRSLANNDVSDCH